MARETAKDANDTLRPTVGDVDRSVEHTQALLAKFRDEIAHFIHKVHEDVERLREITLGEPGRLPWIERGGSEQAEADWRLAGLIDREQAQLETRILVKELVDEQFNHLNALIQTQLARSDSLRSLSRRKR